MRANPLEIFDRTLENRAVKTMSGKTSVNTNILIYAHDATPA
jgi:hypothetical protein